MMRYTLMMISLLLPVLLASCRSQEDTIREYIPPAPDYEDSTMWYVRQHDATGDGADVFYVVSTWTADWTTPDGLVCHYADVWSPEHRSLMDREIGPVGDYMGVGNNFYAPYYRHTTIEAYTSMNDDTIRRRCVLPMQDVKDAFDYFYAHRDTTRPFILAGFSQGAQAVVALMKHISDQQARKLVAAYVMGYKVTPDDTAQCHRIRPASDSADVGVTICYNTVKDVRYVKPVVAKPCVCCINPVIWRTDSVPALLHDTITVTCSPYCHVLVVQGYEGNEYPPIGNILNNGDIHGCEPWLYKESLQRNIVLRTRAWRQVRSWMK